MYVKGTEAQESLAAAEWQWPQRFSRSELIKVPFKALTLLYCPALSQVLRQNMPEHLHRRELCGEKSSSLATVTQVQLWTQLVQQTWVHSSNQCHQKLLGQSRAHASKQGTVPWVPHGLQDSAWAKTTVNKNYSTDAKDVLTEVLICGMRLSVGHSHPHANSPQCSSKQRRHRCHVLQSSHSNTMKWQHPSHF